MWGSEFAWGMWCKKEGALQSLSQPDVKLTTQYASHQQTQPVLQNALRLKAQGLRQQFDFWVSGLWAIVL